MRLSVTARAPDGKLLHPGKRQDPGDVARLHRKHDRFAADFAAAWSLPLKNHKHRVGRIALAEVCLARLEMQFLRLAEEPGDLIVGQISECRNAK